LRKTARNWRKDEPAQPPPDPKPAGKKKQSKGTFVKKYDARWLKGQLSSLMPVEIYVWRSISVKHMRTYIHQRFAGGTLLRTLFWLEERFPHFFGERGLYPLIVIEKQTGLEY
jgi:hypothetical protein